MRYHSAMTTRAIAIIALVLVIVILLVLFVPDADAAKFWG